MAYDRGEVLLASDPFHEAEDAARPLVVVSTSTTPFHGEQYVCLSLTTRDWHDESITTATDDWLEGGVPRESYIMPWSVTSVPSELIERKQGRLSGERVDQATERLSAYLS